MAVPLAEVISKARQWRVHRLNVPQAELVESFEEQSSALREQYAEVSKRLDSLTMWLAQSDDAAGRLACVVAAKVAKEEPWKRARDSGWGR